MIKNLTHTFNACRKWLGREFKRACYGPVGPAVRPAYNLGHYALGEATKSKALGAFYSVLLVVPLGWWVLSAIFLPKYAHSRLVKKTPPAVCSNRVARFNRMRPAFNRKSTKLPAPVKGRRGIDVDFETSTAISPPFMGIHP